MSAAAALKGPRAGEAESKPRPYEESRLAIAAIAHGEVLHLTLPTDETIEEGQQDPQRWVTFGPKLSVGQWLEVTNDSGSFWGLFRVEGLHGGGRGLGMRALRLKAIVPPVHTDATEASVVSTGEFYVRWMGGHKKWCVVSPTGTLRHENFGSEAEARVARDHAAQNHARLR